MGKYWNEHDVRHFQFNFDDVVDWYTRNDAIARGLGYPRSDETTIPTLRQHLGYQECVYHYHFVGWSKYAARFPRKSRSFLRPFLLYAKWHPQAFYLHLY